jgi:hypothetical protein
MFKGRGGYVPYAGKRTQIRAYPVSAGFKWFVGALAALCVLALLLIALLT